MYFFFTTHMTSHEQADGIHLTNTHKHELANSIGLHRHVVLPQFLLDFVDAFCNVLGLKNNKNIIFYIYPPGLLTTIIKQRQYQ